MTSTPRTRIRIAAVGLGWVSQNRHLPAISRSPEFELTGVIDSRPERAAAIAAKYRTRHAVARRVEDVPWLEHVDAVVIGAPPGAHAELIRAALLSGKHVITEKPFVLDAADARPLSRLAHERGCVLAIVHNFQFARSFLRLQADIAAGRLGAIRNIWALQLSNPARRLPAWYGELPGGLFFDESPHLLYLVRRLLPDMVLAHARRTPSSNGATTPAEVYVQLRNDAGQTATLLMNFEAALSEWHVVVSGERGTADVDIFRDIYHFAPNDGVHTARDILRTSFSAATSHLFGTVASGWLHVRSRLDYGNREIFRRFADAIRTRTLQPEYIGSHEAVAVRELQQEILEA